MIFQRIILISSLCVGVSLAWTTFTAPVTLLRQHNARHESATALRMALPSTQTTPLVKSRQPHKLDNGRGTFLGFRDAKDFKNKNDVTLQSSPTALMPDGGLSPCVIRVLGVGGGGCNAVRHCL